MSRVHKVVTGEEEGAKNVRSYEKEAVSPSKSSLRVKPVLLKQCKASDLTPSTKKSRVLSTPALSQLIEELVDNL